LYSPGPIISKANDESFFSKEELGVIVFKIRSA